MEGIILIVILAALLLLILASCVKIVPQAHGAWSWSGLAHINGTWKVGIHFKVPIIDRVARKVTLKEQVVDFAPQPVITKDNVTMQNRHGCIFPDDRSEALCIRR